MKGSATLMLPRGEGRESVTSSRALLLSQWRGPSAQRLGPLPPLLGPACSLPALGSPRSTKLYKVLAWNPTFCSLPTGVEALQNPRPSGPLFLPRPLAGSPAERPRGQRSPLRSACPGPSEPHTRPVSGLQVDLPSDASDPHPPARPISLGPATSASSWTVPWPGPGALACHPD